jgi:steroid delta-isomerase
MDVSALHQRLTDYLKACESLEPKKIASCFSELAVVRDPDGGVEGKADIVEYFARLYAPLAKLELTARPVYWCGGAAACEWSGQAAYKDGRRVEYCGIDTFEFDDNQLICRLVAYWDPDSLPQ